MDPHMVIGVRRDATPSEIRTAYRRLAKENHPDRFIGSSPMVQRRAQRKMSELNVAYRQIGPRWRVTAAGDSPHAAQQRREEIRRNHRYERWEAAEQAARARADAEREETLRREVEEERHAEEQQQRAEVEQQRAERASEEFVGRTARAPVRTRPETIHGEGISGAELHQQIADLRAELAGSSTQRRRRR